MPEVLQVRSAALEAATRGSSQDLGTSKEFAGLILRRSDTHKVSSHGLELEQEQLAAWARGS